MLERKEVIYLQEQYRRTIGAKKLSRSSKSELLMNIWRYPSLSIHGKHIRPSYWSVLQTLDPSIG